MNSEENSDEYGKNKKNDPEVIQNVLSKRNYHPRRVSFPESVTELVTGYLEPVDPLRLAINVDKTELLRAYELSCRRHNTTPIQTVVNQIKDFYICDDRINSFNLNQVTLTCCGCESLEEIFKRVQFVNIDLTECGLTSDTASALFEMFEYYESAVHLNISNNNNLGILGWQACARYIKKSNMLEELETRDIQLDYNEADCLLKPLTQNKHLQVLKLENCNLNGNSLRSLVNALTNNLTLKELYLADNKIGNMEAALLGTLLQLNKTLQVLDLSNNQIQDEGVNHIVLGLCNLCGCLEMLVLWNNYLTSMCALYFEELLKNYRSLTILNVGCNNLHDSFVYNIMESLKYNQSIQRLGLQKTHITCNSAKYIADILRTNTSIERIDLRENNILFPGVMSLFESLKDNRNVIQIDLNETTSEKNVEEYNSLLRQINAKCAQNKEIMIAESKITSSKAISRKISLTCQTLTQHPLEPLLTEPKKVSGKLRSPAPSPAPSPIPSPVSSPIPPPITKSRFSVSRVTESKGSSIHSRFTVCAVSEPNSLPKPVTSSTGAATVGFDCTPSLSLLTSNPQTQISTATSVNGCNEEKNVELAASDSNLSSYERIKPVESKTMSSIEKLLSIFQAPTNLFTKSSSPPLTRQCDNIKHLPLCNTNTNKNINSSTVNYSDTTSSKPESIKENISPEHSLTLSSVKKINKIEYASSCALDIKDKEIKNSNNSANIGLDSGENTHVKSHTSLPLCSSSEDSDSGLVFDFSSGSVASATDTGSMISDDSATSSTSPPSVQSPGSESDQTDVTNNNKLRSTVSVTVTSTDSNTDHN